MTEKKQFIYMSHIFLFSLLFFLSFSRPVPVRAETSGWDDMGFESEHISTFYDMKSGLPFTELNAVVQTGDGFIYLGGYGGLVRYDGKKFNIIEEVSSVMSLYAAKDGNLWIGTNDKGIICMSPEAEFTHYGKEAGLRSLTVRSIIKDDYGSLIFATGEGIYRMDSSGKLKSIDDERINEAYIDMLSKDDNGLLYGVTYEGNLFSIRDDKLVDYYSTDEIEVDIESVLPDPEHPGQVYMGSEEDYILRGQFGKPLSGFELINTPGLKGINMIKLVEDRLWICADNGIGYIDKEHGFQRLQYSEINSVENMISDYEGNLWFTSVRNGVMKISESIFMDVSLMMNMENRVVNSTWMKDDLLYVGTDTGLLVFDSQGNPVSTPVGELLAAARVRAIKSDGKGNLWFCTFSDHGLVCLQPDGQIVSFSEDNGLLTNYARTVFECSDGKLAVSVTGGLQFIENGQIVRTIRNRDWGLTNDVILSICEGFDGKIYLGTNGNGVYIVDEKGLFPFEGDSDMESGVVLGIRRDDKRNILWIFTSNSLCYMKENRITTLNNMPSGHRNGSCYDLFLPEGDDIWVCGGSGIYVVNANQLLAGENPDYTFYNATMGLPHVTTSNSRNYISPGGDAYIAGIDGVTKVNIEKEKTSHISPKISLPYFDVDDQRIYLDEDMKIRVPHRARRLTIYQYVLSYGLTDPKVSYYLEGFDKEPVVTTKQDLSSVSYTNLPGGTYRFHLSIMDNDRQTTSETVFTLVKDLALYEHPLFWVCLIGFVILATTLILMWYFRRKVLKLEKKREEERIAGELNMATSIQAGALPSIFPAFPDRKEFDIYASMTPAKEVGGDFYDFFMVDDNHLAMVIADVSDKGIPAALFMMSAKMTISSYAKMGRSPAEVLEAANNALNSNNQEKMFVTVWLGILDVSSGILTAANAGHEYPIFMQNKGSFRVFKDKHGFVLGGMPELKYKEYQILLKPGAKLFVYTDGVTDASNSENEFFGMERIVEALNERKNATSKEILEHVKDCVTSFVGDAPQFDDLTMMCIHFIGNK